MKKIINSKVFIFVLGLVVAGSIGVCAYTISSSDVSYDNSASGIEADNVKDAIDDLYTNANYGNAVADDIAAGKTALIQGQRITGTAKTYEEGYHECVSEIVYNNFGGEEIVKNTAQLQGTNITVVPDINPAVFSQVRYYSSWWYGSGSGDYPWCYATGYHEVWLEDKVTGEKLATGGLGGRPGGYNTLIISKDWPNPVDFKASITWSGTEDCTGSHYISNTYLTIRDSD